MRYDAICFDKPEEAEVVGSVGRVYSLTYREALFRREQRALTPALPDMFGGLPLFRVEFTLPAGHPWREPLGFDEQPWFDIELAATGEVEARVYGAF